MKCPVCKTECGNAEKCPTCGFDRLISEFINQEDYERWMEETVVPCQKIYINAGISNQRTRICDPDFEIIDDVLVSYNGLSEIVQIPDFVKRINDNAFNPRHHRFGCVKEIHIPNGVHSIGKRAFNACCGLKKINIPNSVTNIDMEAFQDCSKLTSITLPGSIKCIDEGAFYLCEKLKKVVIQNGVQCIGPGAFMECYELNKITIPDSVYCICADAFWGCNLSTLIIPRNVSTIGEDAFFIGENLVLKVYRNTYAEQYAKENGIKYEYIEE